MNQINSVEIDNTREPFPSFTALRAAHTELLQKDLQPEQSDAVSLVEYFLMRAQATGKLLPDDNDRRSSQNILNYWGSFLYRLEGVPRLVTLAKYDPKATVQVGDVKCPYPGVKAFTEAESQFFFGRQRQIDYVLNRLKEDRLLVLVGPSGSGKTSLIRAGVLPALKRDPDTSTRFYFPPTVPGSDPLLSLARMVKDARNKETDNDQWLTQQAVALKNDENHLLKLIEETTDEPAVLFIDQGEDLYELGGSIFVRLQDKLGLDPSAKVQTAFLGNIMSVVQSQPRRHIVILARRIGDFEPHFRRLPSRFKEVFEPARMVLPSLYPSELGEIIEKPADLLGVTFEGPSLSTLKPVEEYQPDQPKETMVQGLVKQIASEPVGLPLLQFALTKLWDKRVGDKIPDAAFRELGSCREALVKTAEKFYASLDFRGQSSCRRLLRKLVMLGSDLRPHLASVHRSELYSGSRRQAAEEALLKKLEKKQLVRIQNGKIPSEDVVELSHELLLTAWPRMVAWIDGKRRARMWSKVAAVFLLMIFLGLIALGGGVLWGRRQEVEQSRELASRSNKLLNKRFDQALWLGQEAFRTHRNDDTRSNSLRLLHALQSTSRPQRFVKIGDFEIVDLALSSEREGEPSQVAGVQEDGRIIVWNLKTGGLYRSFFSKQQPTTPLTFSADNQILATASNDEAVAVILWNVESGTSETLSQEGEVIVTALAFSPDRKFLVTGDRDGTVVQWDLATKKATQLYKHNGPLSGRYVSTIFFSHDGKLLASASADGTAILSTRGGPARRRTFAPGGELGAGCRDPRYDSIHSLALSPHGDLLAGGTLERAYVWDLKNGKTVSEFSPGSAGGLLLSFNPEGDSLAVWSYNGEITLWNINNEAISGTQLYKPYSASSAAFSGNGKYLALPSEGGLFLWELYGSKPLNVDNHNVKSIAFNHSWQKQRLAVGADDGSLFVFDVEGASKYTALEPTELGYEIASLAFSGDDQVLGVALEDGTINILDANNFNRLRWINAWEALKEIPASSDDEQLEAPVPADLSKLAFSGDPNSQVLAVIVKPRPGDPGHKPGSRIISWDSKNNSLLPSPKIEPDFDVNALAFSKDGSRLALGGSWLAANGKLMAKILIWEKSKSTTYEFDGGTITSLSFDPTGDLLAVGTREGFIYLCKGADGEQFGGAPMKAEAPITTLAFLAGGKLLASEVYKYAGASSTVSKVIMWDVDSRLPVGDSLDNAGSEDLNMALSANGGILAAVSGTNVVLWDVDLQRSGGRFCEIIDCPTYLDKNNTLAPRKTYLQRLYLGASDWRRRVWRVISQKLSLG